MIKTELKEFTNHMEFLGYEFDDSLDEPNSIFCRHPKYGPVLISKIGSMISFKTFFNCNSNTKKKKMQYLALINEINKKALIASFIGFDENIIQISFYTGLYRKKEFGEFLDIWHQDSHRMVFEHEDLQDFIK